ncbi:MAG: phosphoglucosamine mutase [Desulfobacterales bacterium]|nr:phosphoglucosamine mutase [Desulfobacterales bacterium]
MGKLFGTDGIRGKAYQYPITSEMAVQIGKAVAVFFKKENTRTRILIANDSRISAEMLETGLAAGICAMGADAAFCGLLPTPGVAWLAVAENADAGISVSASHNPYDDNGIKIFKGDGFKLSAQEEAQIETLILKDKGLTSPTVAETGRIHRLNDPGNRYREFLASTVALSSLKGMKIVIDCANGATSRIAPQLFADLGAEVKVLFNSPNGKNINDGCGSEHPLQLKQQVIENNANIGIGFDGDGDRLIVVDEGGGILSGDEVLAIFAGFMSQKETLKKKPVVSTVMSNIGLGIALREMGIRHIMTDVGDRHVMEKMKAHGAVLGGENSGHMIFLDYHTTGDGMLSALQLIRIMRSNRKPVSELKKIMTLFPQTLMNVEVKQKPDLNALPGIQKAIQSVQNKLREKGRVLVRYSGTQPLCRVMVEGPTRDETDDHCRHIAECIKAALG